MISRHSAKCNEWFDIALALDPAEIEALIRCLRQLQCGELAHFHLTQTAWKGQSGIADIEFSLKDSEDQDNMQIG